MNNHIELQVKWMGQTIVLNVHNNTTVHNVKKDLQQRTHVPIANQKIMGWLPKGKIPDDTATLASLDLKSPHKLMMIGTPQQVIEKLAEQEKVMQYQAEIERIEQAEREHAYREELAIRQKEETEQREREERRRQEMMEENRRRQAELYEQRRREMLEEETRMEVDPSASITLNITCHSIAFAASSLQKPNFEFADKMILPANILEQVVNNRLQLPITFRISAPRTSAHIAHAGVLDFTAPDNTAYLPYWIMQKLEIEEGDEIELKTVKLPKGSFVKLKPLGDVWVDIPSRELLEHHLRNYQSLTSNDIIKIEHHKQTYDLRIVSVKHVGEKPEENSERKPVAQFEEDYEEKGISITDTDLTVDIEGVRVGKNISDIELGKEEINLAVPKDDYAYFTIVLPEFTGGGFVIDLKPVTGDPDLYVSTKQRYPTQKDFMWASQHKGAKRLVLTPSDPQFAMGRYYIGVHGFQSDATFNLIVTLHEEQAGQTLGAGGSSSTSTETKICSNCKREIAATAIVLHELQCARRNFKCPQCGSVMPIEQRDKHLAVAHSLLKCECGKEFEQDILPIHKEYECPRRREKCVYCGLEVPFEEKGAHQKDCGSRTATCPHCNKIFMRREMKTHIVQTHEIYPDNEEFF